MANILSTTQPLGAGFIILTQNAGPIQLAVDVAAGAVASVFGRTGAVVAQTGDYSIQQIGGGGASVGTTPIWNGSQWVPDTDFGARQLQTSGALLLTANTAFLRFGLAPNTGSGVSSSASQGGIRLPRGSGLLSQIWGRNNLDTADVFVLGWDSANSRVAVGVAGTEVLLAGGQLTIQGGTNSLRETVSGPRFSWNTTGIGFYATAPIAKPTITGAKGGNVALTALLIALSNFGLVTDATT